MGSRNKFGMTKLDHWQFPDNLLTCLSMSFSYVKFFLVFILILAISAGAFFLLQHDRTYGDENIHYYQISQFLSNHLEVYQYLTTIPGYHVVIFSIARIFGFTKLLPLRLISF